MMNSRHRNAIKEWPLICTSLNEGLTDRCWRSKKRREIKDRGRLAHRFPVRWERSSGPPVLVVKKAPVTTPNWLQSLSRFCGLS